MNIYIILEQIKSVHHYYLLLCMGKRPLSIRCEFRQNSSDPPYFKSYCSNDYNQTNI